MNHLVYEAVARFGGSFSAEHGIGELKVSTLEAYQSPVALSMMRSIKQALDPRGLFNPGRVEAHRARPGTAQPRARAGRPPENRGLPAPQGLP